MAGPRTRPPLPRPATAHRDRRTVAASGVPGTTRARLRAALRPPRECRAHPEDPRPWSALSRSTRSSSVSWPSRTSRAKALRASIGVPHQTTMRFSSPRSRRLCAVVDCAQHSGTIALASQNAMSVRLPVGADGCGSSSPRDARPPRCPERRWQRPGPLPQKARGHHRRVLFVIVYGERDDLRDWPLSIPDDDLLAGPDLLKVLCEVVTKIRDVGAAHSLPPPQHGYHSHVAQT